MICQYPGLAPEAAPQLLAFEKSIIELQMQLEESFTSFAKSTGKPSVVVFDRGLLDIPAYLPRDSWLGAPHSQLIDLSVVDLSETDFLSSMIGSGCGGETEVSSCVVACRYVGPDGLHGGAVRVAVLQSTQTMTRSVLSPGQPISLACRLVHD